ncbi:hypothetical protein CPB86DRAFT_717445 [Serendipita vermifera]|nr:hypothetical protein CPB86DRAFT_717445 [Serendipita vermifera]
MHLLFENIIPMMISLWKGDYREIDTTNQPYVITRANWEAIGRLTTQSNAAIPAFFSRPIPDIHVDQHLFTAEAYAFWFMHMAPALLRGRFPEAKYYDHAMILVRIVQTCINFEITIEHLDLLEQQIILWVKDFEKYYYQYDVSMLQVCTLPIHSLLHVPYDIRSTGPVSVCWAWVMERFCGTLGIAADKGRRYPNTTLAYRVHAHALINYFEARYNLGLKALYRTGRIKDYLDEDIEDPGRIPNSQYITLIIRRARKYKITARTFEALLPQTMEKYSKIQILRGGDKIRGSDSTSMNTMKDRRDASFVRYTLFPDKNADDIQAEDVPEKQITYGRFHHVIVFTLPALPNAGQGFSLPTIYRLACVRACRGLQGRDAAEQFVEFEGLEPIPAFVHVGVIECAVGRIRTDHGWSIIDRSSEWARTIFVSEDIVPGSDNE